MKFDFKAWDLGGKIIFLSLCLAVLSLFFKWVELGFVSANGFSQQGFIFLVVFLYPVIMLLKEASINKVISYGCAIVGVIACIGYISSKSVDLFGTTINAASTGPYVFLVACIALGVGTFLHAKN